MQGHHLAIERVAQKSHEAVDDEVDGEVFVLFEAFEYELLLLVEPGHQRERHHDVEQNDLEDLVVGEALGGVHHRRPLFAPLLEPLHTLEHQVVLLHDHFGQPVLLHLGLVGLLEVDQVKSEAERGIEQQQPRVVRVFDLVQHDVLVLEFSQYFVVDRGQVCLRNQVDV
eukprot:CAMPEP_0116909398 /NCGR_PEP_ID=MMETSP0467-20121206/14252_1 /TAXON_ID=283647 /ORGANISM="Mesodinium pulex, Strain SPMC105" /LENGTH=168 /DNA_ID=CAMNT_0004584749 /DNA_START=842 /DNA_END=1348 /DNA_ORIENTATION=-